MNSFLVSTGVVSIAEIGDKTQLLALLLASKFRKPIPIILGILIATLANHAGAAAIGAWFGRLIGGRRVAWPGSWRGLFAGVRWPTGAIAPSMTVPTRFRGRRRALAPIAGEFRESKARGPGQIVRRPGLDASG